MKCREAQQRLPDYTTGNLNDRAIEELERHLAACAACAAEASRLRSVWERLAQLPEEELSAGMHTRFEETLEQHEAEAGAGTERFSDDRMAVGAGRTSAVKRKRARTEPAGWWPRRPVMQFGLALVILAAGLGLGWHLRPDPGNDGDMGTLRAEVQHLRNELARERRSPASSVDRLSIISDIRQMERPPAPAFETLLRALVSDPSVNVRLAAVDVLADHLDRQTVRDGLRESLSGQSSAMVQIALIETLAGLDDPQGQRAIRDLATDDRVDPAVRAHVRWRLGRSL